MAFSGLSLARGPDGPMEKPDKHLAYVQATHRCYPSFSGLIREYAVELDLRALHLLAALTAPMKKARQTSAYVCRHNTDVYPVFSGLLRIREYAVELDSLRCISPAGPAAYGKSQTNICLCASTTQMFIRLFRTASALRTLYHTGPGKGKVIR